MSFEVPLLTSDLQVKWSPGMLQLLFLDGQLSPQSEC